MTIDLSTSDNWLKGVWQLT